MTTTTLRTPAGIVCSVLALTIQLVSSAPVWAAESWVEVKSTNFIVWSNGGERTARDVAWQFEQIHGAIQKGWPWARPRLSVPLLVVALKDEASMKVWAPHNWETAESIRPASVAASASRRLPRPKPATRRGR